MNLFNFYTVILVFLYQQTVDAAKCYVQVDMDEDHGLQMDMPSFCHCAGLYYDADSTKSSEYATKPLIPTVYVKDKMIRIDNATDACESFGYTSTTKPVTIETINFPGKELTQVTVTDKFEGVTNVTISNSTTADIILTKTTTTNLTSGVIKDTVAFLPKGVTYERIIDPAIGIIDEMVTYPGSERTEKTIVDHFTEEVDKIMTYPAIGKTEETITNFAGEKKVTKDTITDSETGNINVTTTDYATGITNLTEIDSSKKVTQETITNSTGHIHLIKVTQTYSDTGVTNVTTTDYAKGETQETISSSVFSKITTTNRDSAIINVNTTEYATGITNLTKIDSANGVTQETITNTTGHIQLIKVTKTNGDTGIINVNTTDYATEITNLTEIDSAKGVTQETITNTTGFIQLIKVTQTNRDTGITNVTITDNVKDETNITITNSTGKINLIQIKTPDPASGKTKIRTYDFVTGINSTTLFPPDEETAKPDAENKDSETENFKNFKPNGPQKEDVIESTTADPKRNENTNHSKAGAIKRDRESNQGLSKTTIVFICLGALAAGLMVALATKLVYNRSKTRSFEIPEYGREIEMNGNGYQ